MKAIAINAATILIGSTVGMIIRNNVRKSMTDAIMIGIGLFTVYMGITGLTSGVNALVYLLALVLGGVTGTALQIEERIDKLSVKIQSKLTKDGTEDRFAAGLAGFFIISCSGAYTIVACFNTSLGNNAMLYTKAVMDLVVSMAMAASLGAGVLLAGVPIILYECILVGFAGALTPVMSEAMTEAVTCMGAILTIAIGANVAGVSRFKVMNYVPSLVLAPLFAFLAEKIL